MRRKKIIKIAKPENFTLQIRVNKKYSEIEKKTAAKIYEKAAEDYLKNKEA